MFKHDDIKGGLRQETLPDPRKDLCKCPPPGLADDVVLTKNGRCGRCGRQTTR